MLDLFDSLAGSEDNDEVPIKENTPLDSSTGSNRLSVSSSSHSATIKPTNRDSSAPKTSRKRIDLSSLHSQSHAADAPSQPQPSNRITPITNSSRVRYGAHPRDKGVATDVSLHQSNVSGKGPARLFESTHQASDQSNSNFTRHTHNNGISFHPSQS